MQWNRDLVGGRWLVLAGAGLLGIALVAISLVGIFQRFDALLQDTVDEVIQAVVPQVDEALGEARAQHIQRFDEALEEALERFGEALQEAQEPLPPTRPSGTRSGGDPEELSRASTLSRSDAVRLVKFNISMMTRRSSADDIENIQTLQDVDINSPSKIEYLKGRLAASVRANLGGSLDETRFQNVLRLTTRSTVETAGSNLQRAYRAAWTTN